MRFRQLQALHAVIQNETVTAAAAALGVSQPAISNLLTQLEAESRLKLFQRARGRLRPTPEALVLFKQVDTLMRGVAQVGQVAADLRNQRAGQIQIAATHAVSLTILPPLIAGMAAARPDVQISLQTRYSRDIQEWVAANLYEIGVTETPVDQDGLTGDLFSFDCQCAIPADSPLAELEEVSPEVLDNVPFIVMGAEQMTHHRTQEAFRAAGARWRIRAETHLFRTLLDFVKLGLGVGLVDPLTLAHDDGAGYVLRPFRPVVRQELMLVRARGRPMSALGETLYARIHAALEGYAGLRPPIPTPGPRPPARAG